MPRIKSKTKAGPHKGLTAAIREYVLLQKPQAFTVEDIVQWGQRNGYFYSHTQYKNMMIVLLKQNGCIFSKTEEDGVFTHKPINS